MNRRPPSAQPPFDSLAMLSEILDRNPHIVAAWFDDPDQPVNLHILTADNPAPQRLDLPHAALAFRLHRRQSPRIEILRAPATHAQAANQNQQCQNEPIKLGTQIQPSGASWVGTAGTAVSWITANNRRHWGILSNFHVMAMGIERVGHAQCQPDDRRPPCATLSAWTAVLPGQDNLVDAAIADALIDGYHTIQNSILDIGEPGPEPINATVGLAVAKSGRTTGRTTGRCIGIGAAVNVGYGDFTARFVDQDVFEADSGEFSAPGDSGSLIVGRNCKCPCALLFAGSSQITIGNPFRYVKDALSLTFPFC